MMMMMMMIHDSLQEQEIWSFLILNLVFGRHTFMILKCHIFWSHVLPETSGPRIAMWALMAFTGNQASTSLYLSPLERKRTRQFFLEGALICMLIVDID